MTSRPWTITGRLTWRLMLATIAATVSTGVVVAIHYGADTEDLRQRKVLELAERLAVISASGMAIEQSQDATLFSEHPDAYRWAMFTEAGSILSTSPGGVPTAAARLAWPPPEEWTGQIGQTGWAAGVSLGGGGAPARHLIVQADDDPAGLLFRLVAGEVLVHVVLPLAPFAALVSILGFSVTRRTLRPVRDAARQARLIGPRDAQALLKVHHAPVEIEDLVSALNDALDKIRGASQREVEFVLDAAHALRTPLAALKARLEAGGVEAANIASEVEELTRLASQLLASAAAERLVVSADLRVDLIALTREVAADMAPLIYSHGLEVEVQAPEGAVIVVADRDAVAHALRNLIDNALKASPPASVIFLRVTDDRQIQVIDQGPGVPLQQRAQIVRRFSRHSYGDGQGAGLGLSIVSRIMNAHGGALRIDDAAAGGAVFSMEFPYARSV